MDKENKDDKKKLMKRILIVFGVLIVLLLFLILALKNSMQKTEETQVQLTEEEQEEKITDYVRDKGEKERVEYYLAEYIRNIEKGKYDKAYSKLYPEFKDNYFATPELFEIYVKTVYSDLMSVEYTDIQRQGTYYIITVKITNLQAIETTIEQMFIIHEEGLNDYQISFQVKY